MKLIYSFQLIILVFIITFGESVIAQTANDYYSSGTIKMVGGNNHGAIEDFSKAISKDKNMVDAYFNRGIAYENLQQYGNAIRDYSAVVVLKPSMYQAFNNRGLLYMKTEKYQSAIDDFTISIRIKSDYPFTYLYRASVYLKINKLEEAKEDASLVISLLPNYFKAYYILAEVAYLQKDYSLSLKHYNFICEHQSSNASYFLGRAAVFMAMNNLESACLDYTRAVELGSEEAKVEQLNKCK